MTNIHSKIIAGAALCMLVATQGQATEIKAPTVPDGKKALSKVLTKPLAPLNTHMTDTYRVRDVPYTSPGAYVHGDWLPEVSWQLEFTLQFNRPIGNPPPLDLTQFTSIGLDHRGLRAIKKPNNDWALEATYECSATMTNLILNHTNINYRVVPPVEIKTCKVKLSHLQPSDAKQSWRVKEGPVDVFTNDPLGK